jgi:hypothetical protein
MTMTGDEEEPVGAVMPDGTILNQWDERLRTVCGVPLYRKIQSMTDDVEDNVYSVALTLTIPAKTMQAAAEKAARNMMRLGQSPRDIIVALEVTNLKTKDASVFNVPLDTLAADYDS